ncbi:MULTISPECIES: SDR family oxidoreductase [unclassified Methylobacterium]|nr:MULTISPECIES: SDR family oxidoreductase [unclassified Methylobacterium]PIU04138.1 MAG: short-chain dehydrogenase [Methylobacterium sp. CG09_land_8_20_14_0_10_71_15]PIU15024.1 MAG: short-chain dehydrogenase [Methylobacterium sp. CG08_land_8_20_14_0_20_71_15]
MSARGPMAGKTVLVTGATSGIGYETALGLAGAGACVGLVGRDGGRTERAASDIRAAVPGAQTETFVADLSSQGETRRLASQVRERFARLDVLVNNAGAIFDRRAETVDGIERTWALDHLGYVLLTLELLDLLKASAPARIVNVASAAHARGRIDFDDIDCRKGYQPFAVYCRAKLGNVLFTRALARRLAGSGVTVNALHPGVIDSGFARGNRSLFGLFWWLARPLLKSPAQGAATPLFLATSPEVEGASGGYYSRSARIEPSAQARDEALQERVWAMSLAQLGYAADPTRSP